MTFVSVEMESGLGREGVRSLQTWQTFTGAWPPVYSVLLTLVVHDQTLLGGTRLDTCPRVIIHDSKARRQAGAAKSPREDAHLSSIYCSVQTCHVKH
jgi:hypothetical protein